MSFWMTRACLVAAAVLAFVAVAQDRAELALQFAIHKETVDGDLQGAIHDYEALTHDANRVVAAKAQERLKHAMELLARTTPGKTPDAQMAAGTTVGWYNGDWQTGVPGLANWYLSDAEFARVYDDFVVPEGGWTIVGVFSNNGLYEFPHVAKASWQIRSEMAPGKGGKLIASGVTAAEETAATSFNPDGSQFRIQVDGLNVKLAPGRYWLSVAPVGQGKGYVNATRGKNAVGDPPGNNGLALFTSTRADLFYQPAESIGRGGQLGFGKDFSQGVLIAPAVAPGH
jgi:hypothetical protein